MSSSGLAVAPKSSLSQAWHPALLGADAATGLEGSQELGGRRELSWEGRWLEAAQDCHKDHKGSHTDSIILLQSQGILCPGSNLVELCQIITTPCGTLHRACKSGMFRQASGCGQWQTPSFWHFHSKPTC